MILAPAHLQQAAGNATKINRNLTVLGVFYSAAVGEVESS